MESSESTDNQDENKNNSQTKKLTQIKKQVLKKSKKIRTDAVLHKYKETKLLNARTPLVDKVLNEPNIESKNEPSLQKSNPNQKLTELKNLKIILSPIKISSQNSLSGHEQRSQLNLVESEKDKVTGNKSNSEAAGLVAKENDYSCFGSWLGLNRLGHVLGHFFRSLMVTFSPDSLDHILDHVFRSMKVLSSLLLPLDRIHVLDHVFRRMMITINLHALDHVLVLNHVFQSMKRVKIPPSLFPLDHVFRSMMVTINSNALDHVHVLDHVFQSMKFRFSLLALDHVHNLGLHIQQEEEGGLLNLEDNFQSKCKISMVHLGQNIFVLQQTYEFMKRRPTIGLYRRECARSIWGDDIEFANSCLTPDRICIAFPEIGPTTMFNPNRIELFLSLIDDYIKDNFSQDAVYKRYKLLHEATERLCNVVGSTRARVRRVCVCFSGRTREPIITTSREDDEASGLTNHYCVAGGAPSQTTSNLGSRYHRW
uniref:Uncharacterized protein n=1 Tax=Trichogramma kaykai TaxID=54128 RepID=A0ABD2WAH0_9HYME